VTFGELVRLKANAAKRAGVVPHFLQSMLLRLSCNSHLCKALRRGTVGMKKRPRTVVLGRFECGLRL
jgi:hypothetical protein